MTKSAVRITVTTPLIMVSYVVSVVGMSIPLLLTIAIVMGGGAREDTAWMLTALWALMLACFLWSALTYRALRSVPAGFMVVRGLPPFRIARVIAFEEVRRVYITDYSYRLRFELNDGSALTVANYYSVARSPLPEVQLEAGAPRGAYKVLKALCRLIEEQLAEGAVGPSTATTALGA